MKRLCAALLFLIVCLSTFVTTAFSTSAGATYPTTLTAGQSLRDGTSLNSPNGLFEFGLVYNGWITGESVVLLNGARVYGISDVFAVPTPGPHSVLQMQTDGNLVLRATNGAAIWASGTRGTGARNTFFVQNDGNLVIRTAAGRVVWASSSGTALLAAGQALAPGRRLVSHYRDATFGLTANQLVMQTDGNLVQYLNSQVAWQSRTHVRGSTAYLQTDGNLVVRGPNKAAVWSSGTAGFGRATHLEAGTSNVRITNGSACADLIVTTPPGSAVWRC